MAAAWRQHGGGCGGGGGSGGSSGSTPAAAGLVAAAAVWWQRGGKRGGSAAGSAAADTCAKCSVAEHVNLSPMFVAYFSIRTYFSLPFFYSHSLFFAIFWCFAQMAEQNRTGLPGTHCFCRQTEHRKQRKIKLHLGLRRPPFEILPWNNQPKTCIHA